MSKSPPPNGQEKPDKGRDALLLAANEVLGSLDEASRDLQRALAHQDNFQALYESVEQTSTLLKSLSGALEGACRYVLDDVPLPERLANADPNDLDDLNAAYVAALTPEREGDPDSLVIDVGAFLTQFDFELTDDFGEKTWRKHEECSASDLSALLGSLQRVQEKQLNNLHRAFEADRLKGSDFRFEWLYLAWVKESVLSVMLDSAALAGPTPISWEDTTTEQRESFGHPTLADAKDYGDAVSVIERRLRIELRLQDLCPGFPSEGVSKEVKEQLSEEEHVSIATIRDDLAHLRDIATE